MDKQMITIRNIEFETYFFGRTAINAVAARTYDESYSKRVCIELSEYNVRVLKTNY